MEEGEGEVEGDEEASNKINKIGKFIFPINKPFLDLKRSSSIFLKLCRVE